MATKSFIGSAFLLRVALYLFALTIIGTIVAFVIALSDMPETTVIAHYRVFAVILSAAILIILLVVIAFILWFLEQQTIQLSNLTTTAHHIQNQLAANKEAATTQIRHSDIESKQPSTITPEVPQAKVPEGYSITPDVYPLLDALHEVRDILLMSEDQRADLRQRRERAKREHIIAGIHNALDQDMWDLAHLRLSELPENDPAYTKFQQRLSQLKQEARNRTIASAKEQLHHLMAIAEWPRAEEIIAELKTRFPDDPEVQAQAAIVQREHEAFVREHIHHMLADLKAATDNKDWRRALLLAEQLVSRYPNDTEISRLQMDLPTLRENADAQERREEEVLFKELLLGQRYEEALQVAERVMNRFPGSPTAVELEKLLPKVRELAAKKN